MDNNTHAIMGVATDFYIHPPVRRLNTPPKVDFLLTTEDGNVFDVRWQTKASEEFAKRFSGKLPECATVSVVAVPFPSSTDPNEFLALSVQLI